MLRNFFMPHAQPAMANGMSAAVMRNELLDMIFLSTKLRQGDQGKSGNPLPDVISQSAHEGCIPLGQRANARHSRACLYAIGTPTRRRLRVVVRSRSFAGTADAGHCFVNSRPDSENEKTRLGFQLSAGKRREISLPESRSLNGFGGVMLAGLTTHYRA